MPKNSKPIQPQPLREKAKKLMRRTLFLSTEELKKWEAELPELNERELQTLIAIFEKNQQALQLKLLNALKEDPTKISTMRKRKKQAWKNASKHAENKDSQEADRLIQNI